MAARGGPPPAAGNAGGFSAHGPGRAAPPPAGQVWLGGRPARWAPDSAGALLSSLKPLVRPCKRIGWAAAQPGHARARVVRPQGQGSSGRPVQRRRGTPVTSRHSSMTLGTSCTTPLAAPAHLGWRGLGLPPVGVPYACLPWLAAGRRSVGLFGGLQGLRGALGHSGGPPCLWRALPAVLCSSPARPLQSGAPGRLPFLDALRTALARLPVTTQASCPPAQLQPRGLSVCWTTGAGGLGLRVPSLGTA